VFCFYSTFTGTYLELTLADGRILIKSDNLSAITILKDQMTQDASMRKITLEIQSEINDSSVLRVLELLHPKVQY